MLSDEVFVESESQSSNDNSDQSSGNQESSSVAEVTHFCTECNDKFGNKDSLEDHILDVHPPTCPLCSNIFVDNENLQFHMKHSHTPSCNKCDAEFQQQSDLEEHIRDHLQTVQVHKCNHCDGEFTSEDLLGDHMNTDHLPSVRQLDCPLCNDIFNSEETFRVHFVEIHKNLVHSDINATSEIQSEVTGNGSASNNQIPETKQCNECEETFSSKEELKQHFENEHSFSCTMCNFNGSTQITMERHILDAHVKKNKSGKFTCDE